MENLVVGVDLHPMTDGEKRATQYLLENGWEEFGSGDDFTMYSRRTQDNLYIYLFDNKWELHNFDLGKDDDPKNAIAKASYRSGLAKLRRALGAML